LWFNKTNSTKNNECSSVNGMFSCEIPSGVVIGALFVLLSTISEGVVVGRKVGLVFSPGIVGGVSSQKNCRFSGRLFHHRKISNKSVTILEHVDEDNQNRRPVVFDHQRRRGGQTNGETVFPRL
jgi:hypothetical protein